MLLNIPLLCTPLKHCRQRRRPCLHQDWQRRQCARPGRGALARRGRSAADVHRRAASGWALLGTGYRAGGGAAQGTSGGEWGGDEGAGLVLWDHSSSRAERRGHTPGSLCCALLLVLYITGSGPAPRPAPNRLPTRATCCLTRPPPAAASSSPSSPACARAAAARAAWPG